MATKTKKKVATKTEKKVATKTDGKKTTFRGAEVTVDECRKTLLAELRAATTAQNQPECKRLRGQLRTKCNHYGGLRNRTYVEKSTGEKIHIDKK